MVTKSAASTAATSVLNCPADTAVSTMSSALLVAPISVNGNAAIVFKIDFLLNIYFPAISDLRSL